MKVLSDLGELQSQSANRMVLHNTQGRESTFREFKSVDYELAFARVAKATQTMWLGF